MKTKWTQQLVRVFDNMTDGRWHTLQGLSSRVKAPTQSVSARIRDLRKQKFGAYKVDRQPRHNNGKTVYVYRLSI